MATARGRRMKAGDCGRKPGVLISFPCLSHHQETNPVPLKTSATPTGWLHGRTSEDVWRTKWKWKNVQKGIFVYDRHGLICVCVCVCIGKPYWLEFSLDMQYTVCEWKKNLLCTQWVHTAHLQHIFPLKSRDDAYLKKNKQTSLASAAAMRNRSPQEMKMPAWNCHHMES